MQLTNKANKAGTMSGIIIGLLLGAAAGFGYYYFVGCRSGTCPLVRNPYSSTLFGAVCGALAARM